MVYTLRFFSSSKCSLFHNSNVFGSCIIHILYTWCAKIKKKNNFGAKRLIKDDSNYVFRPIAAIIRFSSESMVVVLYGIGMVMSRWWDLNICDVCYMVLFRDTGGGYLWCALSWGVCSSSVSARCCPMWVSSYCLSISDVYCWWAFVVDSMERRKTKE
jgi:hypothetical protein